MEPRTPHPCYRRLVQLIAGCVPPLLLIGCSSTPLNMSDSTPQVADAGARPQAAARRNAPLPALPPAGSGRGGYYKDDGPGDSPPEGLLDTPDAEPKVEAYYPRNLRPYVVFGKTYVPISDERPFKQRGIGSWYGKKFHGQKTSSGEPYDMYKMTAAHPTLPIPSYVRVTNVSNGRQVIVRVNDRGPFHSNRIIDLSYTAALKLGYLSSGSSELEVERLLPEEILRMAAARNNPSPQASSIPASQETAGMASPAGSVSAATEARPVLVPDNISTFTLPDAPVAAASPAAISPVPAAVPSTTGTTGSASVSSRTAGTPGSSPGTSGYYLQLGAYSQASNAEAVRMRLTQGSIAGVPMEVVANGNIHRLYGGPFASRSEAAAAAAQLQEGAGVKAMIVQR
ncbi:septal ring lytic transglycosylase RlpA family protein [Noviherbaspirillum sp. CPCC 100848]|uniref:Endolytic peptidoglycan transglycosylase RlpA n=1 Tax=Noviherbaspirillum album TaxID=3080276 RepID=A0ABU6J6E2_9BURK|nr:septal ring lytic transglycosylase RlpA family protein [Noviherbaspirillum sp. CPCC 100848]MEC4718754.1 septal ring lytic transglycosylase RlpA family protein [Noviherbaspirillum sp. CPCC 100848]